MQQNGNRMWSQVKDIFKIILGNKIEMERQAENDEGTVAQEAVYNGWLHYRYP